MKTSEKRTFIILILFLSLLFSQNANAGGIKWLSNFNDAKRDAFLESKLMVIYFEKGSVESSYRMETETWNQPGIIKLSDRFVCIRADVQRWRGLRDQYERLRVKYRVEVYPTIVITDPVGNEFYHGEGFIRGSDLENILKVLPRNLFAVYQTLKVLFSY